MEATMESQKLSWGGGICSEVKDMKSFPVNQKLAREDGTICRFAIHELP